MRSLLSGKTLFTKTVSIFLALTFSFYNVSFSQVGKDLPDAAKKTLINSPLSAEDVAVGIDCGSVKDQYDGANGKMDQPCEVLMRGDDMIISNFDMPVDGGVNTEFETPNCISIIKGASE